MKPRERIESVINRKDIDRIPVDIWYTPEIMGDLRNYCKAENDFEVFSTLGIDKIVSIPAVYPCPDGCDIWGNTIKKINTGIAVYDELDIPALKNFQTLKELARFDLWPKPERFDYEKMFVNASKAHKDFATLGPWTSLFEIYCQMRGIEQALMDLVLMPEFADAAIDIIFRIQMDMLRRFLDKSAKNMDMVFVSDDMGSQDGLLISVDLWKMFFRERMTLLCDLIHSYGLKVFYHSDGAIEPLIPELIEAGIDILNPVQHVCPGMDRKQLKQKYGDQIIFHGGVENQSILPFGSCEDVKQETQKCLQILGRGKQGYICCSCHRIQPGTPVENILSMINTVKEYGD